ncbi:MAG: glycine cleavage system aminomethyltransferase GcvT, partial [Deltaproteobacteria bacterium]|nr:glycine cleavage system aminomethyltransferase GcvT [Deltaproteobacteria bacterium]
YEAGLGWTVKLKKGDFRGRDALVAIKEAGVSRKVVGFEMTARGIGRHGYAILDAAGTKVGEVTSGSPAPTLGKNIGLGYVPLEMSAIGTEIGIEIRGKTVTAVVVKTPFYKRSES